MDDPGHVLSGSRIREPESDIRPVRKDDLR